MREAGLELRISLMEENGSANFWNSLQEVRDAQKGENQALWVVVEEAGQATQHVGIKVKALLEKKGAGSRSKPVG